MGTKIKASPRLTAIGMCSPLTVLIDPLGLFEHVLPLLPFFF